MNFGGRSIVAKTITLRFVIVFGRLDLELPWIFFADQVCWWSFGFLLLQWWWSATMDHKNGHWSIYRVFSIVESPNPFRIFVSFRSRRKLWILYAIIIWICYNGSKFDDFVKVPLQCVPAPWSNRRPRCWTPLRRSCPRPAKTSWCRRRSLDW